EPGRRAWARSEPDWGIWGIPERDLQAVPEVAGKDVLEFGCGTAYWSAWLARRGARGIGLDNSARQLESARQFQHEFGLQFPLIHASAETAPLPDASFDLIFSEYGASLWCDPYRWVPEAARLLRPGGILIFLTSGTLLHLCMPESGEPAQERLVHDYFGMHRFEWTDTGEIEFNLPFGGWIRVLRRNGFAVEDLIELRAPEGATTRYEHVPPEWAHRWPSEQIWKARREG